MKQISIALISIFLLVPAAVFIAARLWNTVLIEVVTWAKPISFWQMLGLMVLLYIIWPGQKSSLNIKDKGDE